MDKSEKGISYGQNVIGSGSYKTYHIDGATNLHIRPFQTKEYKEIRHRVGTRTGQYYSEPMEAVSFVLLGAHVISTDLSHHRYQPHTFDPKEKRIILIDMRDFKNPHNLFECAIYMVASSQHEALEKALSGHPEKRIIYIKDWEPHIALAFYDVRLKV